ncbi:hypothetical protein SDRG_14825 [Saprolegnia diclina VS20]|uniref:Uncharacterized protein n=1 Tax=Saprolegnia diclina (strain VS20) TaxID=1156394 RepID=T0PPL2_SAPDV|nr:hypothetical protein SDRG_14825 [Saprolegnia diclina VS20]EQC27384.1 hypothetical protein SDRG_14825 [Saprolegnia diclina VS20]|eukprot:XP_008619203.1 hypothetical protein SDRG_14825 [Saprolegnia diclina VS20]
MSTNDTTTTTTALPKLRPIRDAVPDMEALQVAAQTKDRHATCRHVILLIVLAFIGTFVGLALYNNSAASTRYHAPSFAYNATQCKACGAETTKNGSVITVDAPRCPPSFFPEVAYAMQYCPVAVGAPYCCCPTIAHDRVGFVGSCPSRRATTCDCQFDRTSEGDAASYRALYNYAISFGVICLILLSAWCCLLPCFHRAMDKREKLAPTAKDAAVVASSAV